MIGRILRLLPHFIYANSEGSAETARMRRLAWAFAGRLCDKYHNLMSWLKFNFLTLFHQIIRMNNERFAVPEILFRPSDVGVQEMGITESLVHSIGTANEGECS